MSFQFMLIKFRFFREAFLTAFTVIPNFIMNGIEMSKQVCLSRKCFLTVAALKFIFFLACIAHHCQNRQKSFLTFFAAITNFFMNGFYCLISQVDESGKKTQ